MKPTNQTLIIVPTYNEVGNIDQLHAEILKATPEAHVLFVDDNSQDGTQVKIDALMVSRPKHVYSIRRSGKLGLGTAYIAGFKWALQRDYQVIVEMDADLSHDPAELPRLVAGLTDADVVIGSRYVAGGGTRNWGFVRKLISQGGSLYARLILGLKTRDLTGGHNLWKRAVLETMDLGAITSEGYCFQIELKYRALLLGFRVRELPIIFVDRRVGSSKMSGGIVWEAVYKIWTLRGLAKV